MGGGSEAAREPDECAVEDEEVPAPTAAAVRACQYGAWAAAGAAPPLADATFPAAVVPLPPAVALWLLADGAALPPDAAARAFPARRAATAEERLDSQFAPGDSDGDTAGEEEEEEDPGVLPPPEFAAVQAEVEAAIAGLGGAVVPKLNWSAPKDATWLSSRGGLKCCNAAEVFLLLKASDCIVHDLCHAFDACADGEGAAAGGAGGGGLVDGVEWTLVLREWRELSPAMEFRCFAAGERLIGACQRDVANFYPFLGDAALQEEVCAALETFVESTLTPALGGGRCCFDVYVTRRRRVLLVDVNPWGGATLPLLFSWAELEADAASARPEQGVDLRVIESQQSIRLSLRLGVPLDLYDSSPDGAIAEFLRRQQQAQEAEGDEKQDEATT